MLQKMNYFVLYENIIYVSYTKKFKNVILLIFVNFYVSFPWFGSFFVIRIRIREAKNYADPDPHHWF